MTQYIDKAAVVAEIERRMKLREDSYKRYNTLSDFIAWEELEYFKDDFLPTLEVKEVDIWHLQEKEDIYNAVNDWETQTFACVMKDGTIQKFIGWCDEDYEGHVNVHIDGVNNDYVDDVDDIVKWAVINDM